MNLKELGEQLCPGDIIWNGNTFMIILHSSHEQFAYLREGRPQFCRFTFNAGAGGNWKLVV